MHLKYWMIVYLHIEHDGVDLRNDSDHLKESSENWYILIKKGLLTSQKT